MPIALGKVSRSTPFESRTSSISQRREPTSRSKFLAHSNKFYQGHACIERHLNPCAPAEHGGVGGGSMPHTTPSRLVKASSHGYLGEPFLLTLARRSELSFRFHTRYDRNTCRAYVEFREADADGGQSLTDQQIECECGRRVT